MAMPYDLSSSYGDYCFEDHDIIVEMINDDPPELRTDVYERVGGDGSVLRSSHLGTRTITLNCRAFRDRWEDFDAVKDEISLLIASSGTRELTLRNHFGEHYVAKLVEYSEDERIGGTGIGAFTLTFTAYDPVRFGAIKSVAIPSGGAAGFLVTGNYPSDIVIKVTNAVGNSSGIWGVRFDDGDYLQVKLPTSSGTSIDIDSYTRTVKVAGNGSIVTLESNWPTLKTGEHTVTMSPGTGTATMTWQERNV